MNEKSIVFGLSIELNCIDMPDKKFWKFQDPYSLEHPRGP